MRNFTDMFASLRAAFANRTDPEGVQLLARVFWRAMLLLSIIAIVLSIGFGILQLLSVLGTFSVKPEADAALPITLDRAKLDATLSAFDARKKMFESIPSATSTYPDPSR